MSFVIIKTIAFVVFLKTKLDQNKLKTKRFYLFGIVLQKNGTIFSQSTQIYSNPIKMDVDDAVVPDVTTPSTELYERKRKQLFDSLLSAEKKIEGTILEQKSVVELAEERRPKRTVDVAALDITDRRFHGKESIFKKPPPGIMKCLKPRKTPGYQVIDFLIVSR